jgi:dihydropteroate synthase
MVGVIAAAGCDCCLMHMQGEPRTMQQKPHYDDVVAEVEEFLAERLAFAVAQGIAEQRILLDPGIGFGKTVAHNLELLRRLDELVALGRPVVIGTSRKGFLGRIAVAENTGAAVENARAVAATGAQAPRERVPTAPASTAPASTAPASTAERLPGTIATNVLALERGASVFRVHDVAPVAAALATAAATLAGTQTTNEASS